MSMSFWIYLNEPNDKAIVHAGDCPFCDEGRGVTAEKLEHNGRWLGPYKRDAALAEARRAGKKNTRWCGHCARRLRVTSVDIGRGS